jgi:NADH-quinone oxidoreductase subunit J
MTCSAHTFWRLNWLLLLLAGLVVAFHVGREDRMGEVLSNRTDDRAKRKTEERA